MAVHGAQTRRSVSYETDRARFIGRGDSRRARRRCATPAPLSGQRGLGARSDRRDPPAHHARPEQTATVDIVIRHRRNPRRLPAAWSRNTRTGTWPTACSTWPGRTARWCCASSTPPRPTRSSTGAWPARSSTPTPSLRADASVLLRKPARPVRPVGLRDLRRPADRAAADRRPGEHRTGAPAGAGARVLAAEGPGGRPGDLERGRGGYRQVLQDQIMGLIAAGIEAQRDRPARRHLRARAPSRCRTRTASCCRRWRAPSSPTAAAAWPSRSTGARRGANRAIPRFAPTRSAPRRRRAPPPQPTPAARPDPVQRPGRIHARRPRVRDHDRAPDRRRPRPGSTCSPTRSSARSSPRAAAAYTWSENAHEFRLTPWHNDPVSDAERRGDLPARRGDRPVLVADAAARAAATRRLRHAATASATASSSTARTASLPSCGSTWRTDAPVKFSVLKLRNDSGRPRRLSATGYVEWVLGDLRPKSAMHVVTEIDRQQRRAVRAQRLQHRVRRPGRVLRRRRRDARRVTGDRTEFLGRNGTLRNPAALARARLSGQVGAALDPCAAIQVPFELADGAGARDRLPPRRRARRRRAPAAWCSASADAARAPRGARGGAAVLEAHARRRAGARRPIRRSTCWPTAGCCTRRSPAACGRRSGYYQSGGAFGFRDQLQDVDGARARRAGAAARAAAAAARRASSRKATCSTGGIRRRAAACARTAPTTTCGCRWRPAATSMRTGDTGVLDEPVPFLEGRAGQPGRGVLLRPAAALARSRRACTSTACARSSTACASASTACR